MLTDCASHSGDMIDTAKSAVPQGEKTCLLYTSDAADERSSLELCGRRIIKKKKSQKKKNKTTQKKKKKDDRSNANHNT